jgi:hypothetical protein
VEFTNTNPLQVSRTLDSTIVSYPIATLGRSSSFQLQSSTDLINWAEAFPGGQFFVIGEEEHFYSPGLGRFSQSASLPSDDIRFFRLIHLP